MKISILFFIAAGLTVIPGILHLNMGLSQFVHTQVPARIGTNGTNSVQAQTSVQRAPSQGGVFGLFGVFFTTAGIVQIFWGLPMARQWGKVWYYSGIAGTSILIAIWTITRFSGNPITGRGLTVSAGYYDEIFQAAFISLTIAILVYITRMKRIDKAVARDMA